MSSRQGIIDASGSGVSVAVENGVVADNGVLEIGGLMPSRIAAGWRFRVRDWLSQLEEVIEACRVDDVEVPVGLEELAVPVFELAAAWEPDGVCSLGPQLEEDWLSLAWTAGDRIVSLTVDLATLEGYLTRDSTEVGVLDQRTNAPVCFTSIEAWDLLRQYLVAADGPK